MPAVLLIFNPAAGRGRGREIAENACRRLTAQGDEVRLYTTAGRDDARQVAAQQGGLYDKVICCGGDGTLSEVTAGLMTLPETKRPVVGYIPAGSTNDFAASLSLPRRAEKAAALLPDLASHPVDIGQLNDRYFTYVASLGAFTEISYSTPQRLKNRFGHIAYLWEGVKEIGAVQPFSLAAEWDTDSIEGNFLFGAVTNATSVAGLLRLDPHTVSLNDGKLELLLIRDPHNPLELVDVLHNLVHQRYDSRHICFVHTSRVTFHTDAPQPWTLDGEFGGTHTDVTIRAIPCPLQILAPGSSVL